MTLLILLLRIISAVLLLVVLVVSGVWLVTGNQLYEPLVNFFLACLAVVGAVLAHLESVQAFALPMTAAIPAPPVTILPPLAPLPSLASNAAPTGTCPGHCSGPVIIVTGGSNSGVSVSVVMISSHPGPSLPT